MHTSKVQANLKPAPQQWHAQRVAAGIERNHSWTRPSRIAISFCLGISYALGTGQVPV